MHLSQSVFINSIYKMIIERTTKSTTRNMLCTEFCSAFSQLWLKRKNISEWVRGLQAILDNSHTKMLVTGNIKGLMVLVMILLKDNSMNVYRKNRELINFPFHLLLNYIRVSLYYYICYKGKHIGKYNLMQMK